MLYPDKKKCLLKETSGKMQHLILPRRAVSAHGGAPRARHRALATLRALGVGLTYVLVPALPGAGASLLLPI